MIAPGTLLCVELTKENAWIEPAPTRAIWAAPTFVSRAVCHVTIPCVVLVVSVSTQGWMLVIVHGAMGWLHNPIGIREL